MAIRNPPLSPEAALEISNKIAKMVERGVSAREIAHAVKEETGIPLDIEEFLPDDPAYVLNNTLNRRELRTAAGLAVLVRVWPHATITTSYSARSKSATKPRKRTSEETGVDTGEQPATRAASTRKRKATTVPPRKRARRSAARRRTTRRSTKK